MNWNRRYQLLTATESSLWIVPVACLIGVVLLTRVFEWLESWAHAGGFYDRTIGFYAVTAAEAHAMLDRIFNISLTCLVFAFGSILVAIQVAGAQHTPRIIATTLLNNNPIRWVAGLFVASIVWSNRTMVQLGQRGEVPQLQLFLAVLLCSVSVIAFCVLIDYAARLLRPVSLVSRVGERGRAVIKSVYPKPYPDTIAATRLETRPPPPVSAVPDKETGAAQAPALGGGVPATIIRHEGKSGVLMAVNLAGLVAHAKRSGCVVEVVPQVGDFVTTGEPLLYIHGTCEGLNDDTLRAQIALGSERTMDQDPMFAFRILVDFALKALSPAINDPTTAVLAIDQLHSLLRMVGSRSLHDDDIVDDAGHLRVIFRTPNWEDFMHISFTEIRQCGVGSLQVVRRLRAMLENLSQTLSEAHRAALRVESALLDRAVAHQYPFPEDLALAGIPDSQGLGAPAHAPAIRQHRS